MKRSLAVAFLALFTVGAAASPCAACSCVEATPEEYAEDADVVFTGVVKEIIGGDADDGVEGDDELRVRFRVKRVYKGQVRRFTRVRTNESGSLCGYPFDEGKKYTVFATRADGKLWAGSCEGTKKGEIDPAKYGLGEGYPPKD